MSDPHLGPVWNCPPVQSNPDGAFSVSSLFQSPSRLRTLIAGGDGRLIRVACACRAGTEGTRNCNYGRLCGSLSIGGRDVGSILISEGLAHPYVCGATSCPQRRPWC